jgi:hypothetical protein
MKEKIKTFLDSISQGDLRSSKKAFEDLMGDKAIDAVDHKKREVAQQLFTKGE